MLRNILGLFGVGVFVIGWLCAIPLAIVLFTHNPIFATQVIIGIAIPIIMCIIVGKMIVHVFKIDLE